MQDSFFKLLQTKSSANTSFVDEIADVLDVGYDAAYRRINNKTKVTLEEGVILAKHYKVSLNKLFEIGSNNSIVAELPPQPKDEHGLEMWFRQSLLNLTPLTQLKDAKIIWSGKDISLFRTLKDSYLTRYKMYVWLKDLNIEMAKSKISFDEWVDTIPESLMQSALSLGEVYRNINIVELWNDNTVNGSLQQILYYFEAGLLSKDMALNICEDIHNVVNQIEKETIRESVDNRSTNKYFKLYKCDLHTLTNTAMVATSHQKVFFTPFTVLSYFKIEHKETCDMMYDFLQKQMSISKLLSTAGEKDRILFFNKIHQKVNIIIDRIKMDEKMALL